MNPRFFAFSNRLSAIYCAAFALALRRLKLPFNKLLFEYFILSPRNDIAVHVSRRHDWSASQENANSAQ